MISHDIEMALYHASHILYLEKEVFFGSEAYRIKINNGTPPVLERGESV